MEIIAALIVACSNLIQCDGYHCSLSTAKDTKKACIQRVAECAEGESKKGATSDRSMLKACSDKVF